MTDIVDDQVDVVGRAFLGLTVACARCHDHKFDPISTADYYGLAGIFFSTHILPDPGAKTAGSPMLRTPIVPRSTIAAAESYKARLAALERELSSRDRAGLALLRPVAAPPDVRLPPRRGRLRQGGRSAPLDRRRPRLGGSSPATLRRWLDTPRPRERRHACSIVPMRRPCGTPGVDLWARPLPTRPGSASTRPTPPSRSGRSTLPPRSVDLHPGPNEPVAVAWTSPIAGRRQGRGPRSPTPTRTAATASPGRSTSPGPAWTAARLGRDRQRRQGSRSRPIAADVLPGDVRPARRRAPGRIFFDTTTST